jgi:hypothetical protein
MRTELVVVRHKDRSLCDLMCYTSLAGYLKWASVTLPRFLYRSWLDLGNQRGGGMSEELLHQLGVFRVTEKGAKGLGVSV